MMKLRTVTVGRALLAVYLLLPLAASALASEARPPGRTVLAQSAPAAVTGATSSIKVGTLVIDQPWLRATPTGAKVASGYVRITNAGTEPDRLVSASIPLAARGEVHQMSMAGGVMRMAPVEGGLVIEPGQSVELKPGGYHLMFMDLSGALKQGAPVRGTLGFAKAGTVDLTFDVAGMGARTAPANKP